MFRNLILASLLGAVLALSEASADVTTNTHVIVTNQRDPEDVNAAPTSRLMNETNLRGEYGAYQASVGFANRVSLGNLKAEADRPFVLEKKSVSAQWQQWDLRLGDSHHELGRGIALSLYRNDTFGINHTLEGAALAYRPGQGLLEVRAFGGRLNALRAPVAIYAFENPLENRTVWLAGGSISEQAAPGLRLGLHGFASTSRPHNQGFSDKAWQTLGASITTDVLGDATDLYLESNLLFSQLWVGENRQELPKGVGTYAAASWASPRWTAKFEAKDYRDYRFEFRRPPTLEEDIVVTNNTEDVSAFRVALDHRLPSLPVSFQGSYLMGYDRHAKNAVHHGVVGAKLRTEGKMDFELRAGHRVMPEKMTLSHLSLKAKLPTAKSQSLEVGVRKQFTTDNLSFATTEEDKNIFDITYTFSARFSTTLGLEFVPTNDASHGRQFLNLGASYQTSGLQTRALIGQTSGGTLCAGGVCRQVPPYSGAYLETTAQF